MKKNHPFFLELNFKEYKWEKKHLGDNEPPRPNKPKPGEDSGDTGG